MSKHCQDCGIAANLKHEFCRECHRDRLLEQIANALATPSDIEVCAKSMADAYVAWADAAGVRRPEVQIARWAEFEAKANTYLAVLREAGVGE